MGIPGWESDHVTLVLKGADVHQEIQLLFFHQPPIKVDSGAGTLDRTGFNHVCFRVNDLAAMLEHLAENGITPAERDPRLPRQEAGVPRRPGRRGGAGRVGRWVSRPAGAVT